LILGNKDYEIIIVLISCDAGMKKAVLAQLQKIYGVNEIQRLRGKYEIIAKVEANTADHVTNIIGWKIQKMICVRSWYRLPWRTTKNYVFGVSLKF
jgi:hypothetical protein